MAWESIKSIKRRMWVGSKCSICLDFFRDPVILDCGHSFCKACITRCWEETHPRSACPQCGEIFLFRSLRPNTQLASMVELIRMLLSDPKLEEERGLGRKDESGQSLAALMKKKENILLLKAEKEKESKELLKQMEANKKNMAAAFRDLNQFLEEQEKRLLSQMEEVEKEIARGRDEHLAMLSGELSFLDSLIQELEEKQKQAANELLEDPGNILERCLKESSEKPVAFPSSLKRRIHDFNDINPFFEHIMKQFKEAVSGLPLQEASVTVDPDVAHPQPIVEFDDSVRWEYLSQDLPARPERFDCHLLFIRQMLLGSHCEKRAGVGYGDCQKVCEEEGPVCF